MKIFLTGGSNGIGSAIKQSLSAMYQVDSPGRDELNLNRYPQYTLQDFDAIVLCAGSDIGGKRLFAEMEDQHWQNTMQVNLLSSMKLIKDYVSSRGSQWSKIVVFGSTATDYIWPTMIPYSISKLALEQFCRALRQEIDRNIGITIVRPGLVKTNFNMARHQGKVSREESDRWYDSMPHLLPDSFPPVIESILQDRTHSIKEIAISL
jgi:NADP-dependent 3-hydroxy acid dehydrogenase YdfG